MQTRLLNVAPMFMHGAICGSATMVVPLPCPDNNTVCS